MDAPYYNGDDAREFGPKHDICRECGECLCEACYSDYYSGHLRSCSYHPDAYEPNDEYNKEDDVDAA